MSAAPRLWIPRQCPGRGGCHPRAPSSLRLPLRTPPAAACGPRHPRLWGSAERILIAARVVDFLIFSTGFYFLPCLSVSGEFPARCVALPWRDGVAAWWTSGEKLRGARAPLRGGKPGARRTMQHRGAGSAEGGVCVCVCVCGWVCERAGEGRRAADKQVGAAAAGAPGRQGGQRGAADPSSRSPRPQGRLGQRSPARPGPAYRWLSEASRGRARRPRPPTNRVPTPTTPQSQIPIPGSSTVINDFLHPRRGNLVLETPQRPPTPFKNLQGAGRKPSCVGVVWAGTGSCQRWGFKPHVPWQPLPAAVGFGAS